MLQFESKGRKKPLSKFEHSQAAEILFHLRMGQHFCTSQAFN